MHSCNLPLFLLAPTREFNELPHFIKHRLGASHTAAEAYIRQFPSPIVRWGQQDGRGPVGGRHAWCWGGVWWGAAMLGTEPSLVAG